MSSRFSRPLLVLFLVVLANYASQIPYALHLYGLNVNPRGVVLLGLTFAWFLIAFWLLFQRTTIGYWLTLAFLAVQVLFYFENEIVRMFDGYGLVYHLTNFKDPVVWAVELMGNINFIVAAFFLYSFVRNSRALLEGSSGAIQGIVRG